MASTKMSISSISGSTAWAPQQTKQGLGMGMTGFFLIAQMAGAGFLALPRALANTGWLGIIMMLLFCMSVAFVGTRLGRSWVILEERWPQEYHGGVRQPYMDIAERSLGYVGRQIAMWSVVLNLYGSTTVHIILISQMLAAVVQAETDFCLTKCHVILIVGFCLIPLTWLGSPKDFWQASILAVVATLMAVVVIVVQIFLSEDTLDPPQYSNPTVASFSLGFGSILFAFGGAAVFPTIQNDMSDRSQFWKSVIIGFSGILSLYLPVALVGYIEIGDAVDSNILLSVGITNIVVVAIAMEIINLLCTFIISSNPVFQSIEEVFRVPKRFGPRRVVLRTAMVLVQMVIGLAVPNFDKILNLIGGSLITLCTFVLPPVMYMRLVEDRSDKSWPQRTIPLWEKVYLIEIICVGLCGGILSTITSAYELINPTGEGDVSCFSSFSKCGVE
ncbi:amino acid transporter AVT1B-like [Portunus trituberculatus]|uniref:amino acid transporter AVT1B-like n=1 Tax=Portunus trituberculatus TaxID=210409 RepID=UPI001E1CB38E|nr:amino acid transporter AVT1B-like [Portunus trituberculatus]